MGAVHEAGKVGLGLVFAVGAIVSMGAINRIGEAASTGGSQNCRDNIPFQVALETQVKDTLRDPSSFDLIGYGAGVIDADGTQPILMKFRAKNGFGGMNVDAARATVRVDGCRLNNWKLLD